MGTNIFEESVAMERKCPRLHESKVEHRAERTARDLERILHDVHVDETFAEQCIRDCRESAAMPARVVVVGTSNAGKTALANALLGQLLASSDSVPNTVLPVEYVLTEERSYSIDVGGTGVKELLSKSSDLLYLGTPIQRGAAFQYLKIINDAVRKQLHDMQNLAELSAYGAEVADLKSWHVRINVPRDKHVSFLADFVLIDCPGGCEKADADDGMVVSPEGVCEGMAIREMLRWQIERSTMVVCATRSEKMESLRKRHDVNSLFGGQPPLRRHAAFVVNAIDDEDSKNSAMKYLCDNPSILANLEPLQMTHRTFFVSARSMLAFRLCSKVFPSQPQAALDGGFSQQKAKALQNHCNEATRENGNAHDDVWDNPGIVDELKHICQNLNMPPQLARTVMCSSKLRDVIDYQYNQAFSDNVALHKFFAFHLSEEWPQILSESLVNRVLQHLSKQTDVLKRQLELHQLPTDELKTRATHLQNQIENECCMRERIITELKAKLPPRSQLNDACDWLSIKDYGKFYGHTYPQRLIDGFWQNPQPQALAINRAYKANLTSFKHGGSGEIRVNFRTRERLLDFLVEFQRWIARTVAAVFGDGDEGEIGLPEIALPPGDAVSAANGFQTFACGHELTASFWDGVNRDTTAAVLDRIAELKLAEQLAECKQMLGELQAQVHGRLPAEVALKTELSKTVEAEARVKTYGRQERGLASRGGQEETDVKL